MGQHAPLLVRSARLRRIASAVLLIVISVSIYYNSLSNPFIFDDTASIADNASIQHLWPLTVPLSPPNHGEAVSGRPVANVSFALNYAIGGLDVTFYHATNLVLHLTCAWLLFLIVSNATNDQTIALACALLWTVHPLQTEVVDYTVARTESLMALCLLLAVYASIRGWTLAAIVACTLGMGCKETMVVAPIVVVLWDWCLERSRWPRWRLYAGLMSTWVVLVALAVTTPRAHSAGFLAESDSLHPATAWSYFLNQCVVILHYMRLIVVPIGLVLDYGFPKMLTVSHVLPQMVALLAMLAATVIALIKWPRAGFLGAVFFLTLAPSSSIVPIATEVGAERRMYLPSMALIALMAIFAWRFLKSHPRLAVVVVGVVATGYSVLTIQRNWEYRSPLTMWETNVERWPNGRARSNLAAALQVVGRNDEVVPQLRLAVPDFPEARYSLGSHLIAGGDSEAGVKELAQFVQDFPTHPRAGAARDAIATAQKRMASELTDAAIEYAASGHNEKAVAAFRRVVEWIPYSSGAHRNLANALLETRDFSGAAAQAREALRLDPSDEVAKQILAIAMKY